LENCSEESKESAKPDDMMFTLNLESVILVENKLYRISQNVK